MTTATEVSTTVRIAHTEADIRACFRVIAQLSNLTADPSDN